MRVRLALEVDVEDGVPILGLVSGLLAALTGPDLEARGTAFGTLPACWGTARVVEATWDPAPGSWARIRFGEPEPPLLRAPTREELENGPDLLGRWGS